MHLQIDHCFAHLWWTRSMSCLCASLQGKIMASFCSWSIDQWHCPLILWYRTDWSKCLRYQQNVPCFSKAALSPRLFSKRWPGCPDYMWLLYLLSRNLLRECYFGVHNEYPCMPFLSGSKPLGNGHWILYRIDHSLCQSRPPRINFSEKKKLTVIESRWPMNDLIYF